MIERPLAYARDTVAYRYAREAGAIIKRVIFYLGYTIGDYKICKKLIFVRSRFLNIKLLCVKYGICIITAKAYITPRGYISVIIYAREAGATIERLFAYARDAVGDSYLGYLIIIIKRVFIDFVIFPIIIFGQGKLGGCTCIA